MANEKHVKILKQGVEVWNKWRKENKNIIPDLSGSFLSGEFLNNVNLKSANLRSANLSVADLIRSNLSGAALSGAKLRRANLRNANLSKADLSGVDPIVADLSGAKLNKADLRLANFSGANLREADLSGAFVAYTVFGIIDFRVVNGLDEVKHAGPSIIGIDTIYDSEGEIPEVFLKDAGVPDDFIKYMKSQIGKPIDFYSCFISYSSKDEECAKRLHADLQAKGVRCWFAPEDLKIGDKIRTGIDEAIRIYDKLLLLLSENSIESEWVEDEVESAFEKEAKENKTVLFPIRLDDAVMETNKAWAAKIRRSRHIGEFKDWKNHDSYQKAFERLLRDLKAENSLEQEAERN